MHKRKRVFADIKLQGALCMRLIVYWVVCQLSFVVTLIGFTFLSDASASTSTISPADALVPALIISGLLLPVVIVDLLIFSNRFAGPYLRLRRQLESMANGEKTEQLFFRKKDMFQKTSQHLNDVRLKIEQTDESKQSETRPKTRPLPCASADLDAGQVMADTVQS